MTNVDFWNKVAEKWATEDDGVEIPDIAPLPEIEVYVDTEDVSAEIEDILADLDLDI